MPESGMQGFADTMKRFEALRTGKASRLILGQFGNLAVQRAKELVPRKTGNLDRTIRVGNVDETNQTVQVVAGGIRNVGYARMVEFGTRAHIIRPKNKRVLAWGGDRRLSGSLRVGAKATSFARVVRHPGTRGKPYLVPGARAALREVGLANAVIQVWNEGA